MDQNLVVKSICAVSVAPDTLLSSGAFLIHATLLTRPRSPSWRRRRRSGSRGRSDTHLLRSLGRGALPSDRVPRRSFVTFHSAVHLSMYLSISVSRALSLYESVFVRRGLQCSVASAAAPTSEGRARSEGGTDGLRRTNAPRQLHSTLPSTRRRRVQTFSLSLLPRTTFFAHVNLWNEREREGAS